MAQTIKLKRSATQNAVPSTSQLELGEVAINTYDGKMYIKKNDGSDSIVEIGGDATSSSGLDFTGNLNLEDNVRIVIGDGNDLQIYHDGSNSIIQESGTGDLKIQAQNLRLQDNDGTNFLYGVYNGRVELFHNNSKKFETTSSGISVTGAVTANTGGASAVPLEIGSSSSTQFTLQRWLTSAHVGSEAYIIAYGAGHSSEAGNFAIKNLEANSDIFFELASGVEPLRLTSSGITVTGTIVADGLDLGDDNILNVGTIAVDKVKGDADDNTNITFAGNDITAFYQGGAEKIRIDADGRLLIGTTSSIDNLSQLHIVGPTSGRAGITLQDGDSTTQKTFFTQDGGVTRFNTQNGTSHGTFVVGGWNGTASVDLLRVTGDGRVGIGTNSPEHPLHVSFSGDNGAQIKSTDNHASLYINAGSGYGSYIRFEENNAQKYWINADTNGRLLFRPAGGSSNWIAFDSAGQVGIGTTSISRQLHVKDSGATTAIMIEAGDGNQSSIDLKNTEGWFRLINDGGSLSVYDQSDSAERFRVDTSGNLLVSGTEANPAQNNTTDAISLHNVGLLRASTTNAAAPLDLNVKSREGDIATFRKDGTTVGAIQTKTSDLAIGTGDTGIRFVDGDDAILPHSITANDYVNAAIGFGTSNYKFTDIHLSGQVNTGTISSGNITTSGTITFSNSHYLQAGTGNLFFKNSSNAALGGIDAAGFNTAYNYQISGTTVITSARQITNVTSITATGAISTTGTASLGALNVGSSTSGNVFFKRPNANYIFADQSGGYLVFGTNGRSTSVANSNFYLGTNQDVTFNGSISVASNVTSSGLFTSNQNQQGFRHIAPDVMSGHTSRNEMTFSWTADETRWYMFPTVDGSANFNRELSFDYSSEEWSVEGPFTAGELTTTGYLRGPATFTIDPASHGDNTGTVVIAGNLQVDGTTTTINSTTLTVDDKNITLASGSTNAAAANGAGITVDCGSDTDATFSYQNTGDRWTLNKPLHWTYNTAATALSLNNNNIVGVNNISFADPGANEGLQWSNVRIFESPNDLTNASGNLQVTYGGTRRLTVDNTGIQVNGTIANVSGDMTLDVVGDIILDADGGDIRLADSGTQFGKLSNNGTDFVIESLVSNRDIVFKGADGSSVINALILDMSDGGGAYFNNDIYLSDNRAARFGDQQDFRIYNDGSHTTLINATMNQDIIFKGNDDGSTITALTLDMSNAGKATFSGIVSSASGFERGNLFITQNEIDVSSGDLTLDVAGDIILDAAGNDIILKDSGTTFGQLTNDSGNLIIYNSGSQMLKGLSTGPNAQFMGNVGIGTSPGAKLHISGGHLLLNNAIEIRSKDTGGTVRTIMRVDSSDRLQYGWSGNGAVTFMGGGAYTERMRIHTNGNVGIGTTTPGSKLTVEGDIRQTAGDLLYQGGGNWDIKHLADNQNILFYTSQSGSATEKMRIRANGNVGIGTASPDTSLHVFNSGTTQAKFVRDLTTDVGLTIGNDSSGVVFGTIGVHNYQFYANGARRLNISSTGAATFNEAFTLPTSDGQANQVLKTDGSGNVGWVTVQGVGTATEIADADGDTKIQVEESADEDIIRMDIAGTEKVTLNSSNFSIESGGFRVNDPGNNYPFRVTNYGYMTTRSASIAQLNGTDHANVPLSVLADVNTTRTASYVEIGDIGSAGNRFKIDNTGRVGIGTSSPARQFHVENSNVGVPTTYGIGVIEAVDCQLDLISNSSGTWGSAINLVEGNGTSNTDVWSIARQTTGGVGNSSLRFNFGTTNQHTNANKVTINSNGNVGIGTDDPAKTLVVSGTFQATGEAFFSHFDNITSSSRMRDNLRLNFGTARTFAITGNSTNMHMKNGTADVITLDTASNVGIGTSSPATRLHVSGAYGTPQMRIGYDGTAGNGIFFHAQGGSTHTNWLVGQQRSLQGFEITPSTAAGGTTFSTPAFVINTGGDVGVGTIAPYYRIDARFANAATSLSGGTSGNWGSDGIRIENTNSTTGVMALAHFRTHDADWHIGAKRVGTDQADFIFAHEGNTKVSIDHTGNVGIGTTAPGYLLHVDAAVSTDPSYIVASSATNFVVAMGSQNSPGVGQEAFVGTLSNDDLKIKSNNTERIRVKADGKVGIGNSSPSAKLTIHDNSTYNGALFRVDDQYNDVIFNGGSAGTDGVWEFKNAGTWAQTRFYVQDANNADDRLTFDFRGSGTTNKILAGTSSGKVGIGTTTPSALLHLKDTGDAVLIVEADSDNSTETDNARIELRQDGNNVAGYLYTEGNAGQTATGTIANTTVLESKGGGNDVGIHFATGGRAPAQSGGELAGTVRMTVHGGGGVTIGTTSTTNNGGLLVDNDIKGNSRIGVGSGGNLTDAALYRLTDTNTGIYWPAADTLGLTAGGVEVVQISTTKVDINKPVYAQDDKPLAQYHSSTTSAYFGSTTRSNLILASINKPSWRDSSSNTHELVIVDQSQNVTLGTISSGNITTTGYLRGPSTFTIDPATHGDDTGTVVIAGNLQVDGTTTTINSTTLTVDDKNITLASGSTNKAAANGAGITVDCGSDTDARIAYTSATDEWDINKSIHVSGAGGSGVKINSGNAIVGGGASGGDTQLMYWGGTVVYYGRNSLGGTVSGHEFRIGGVTKLNVNSSGNTIASGKLGIGAASPQAKLQIEEAGIDTTTTSTTATTQVAIDTFAAATFRSARYTIQVTNSTDSTYHLTEILLIHNGTTPQITEYGTIFTGSAEATFDADISSGNVRLLATPATTDSMTFKVVRHCITV